MTRSLLLSLVLLSACLGVPRETSPPAQDSAPPASERAPDPEPVASNDVFDDWIDLQTIPGIRFDIRYAGSENFTAAPLPGYGVPGAWLLGPAAESLRRVQRDLESQGLGVLVYDAYRPRRATLAMVDWARRTGQYHLVEEGYIASTSSHNRGNALDLTLVDMASGSPLDMGTPWDSFWEASHTANAAGRALENRQRLVEVMHRHGWKNYAKEWWHFNFTMRGSPLRDRPYSCHEQPEGAGEQPAD